MKKLISLAVAAAAFGFICNASAADMPVKALSYKAPPAGATYNWSGLYVGVNGGYGMGQTTGDWFGLRGGNFDIDGALFGGQIGLNYQFPASPFVIGVEADWDWSGIKGSRTLGPGGGITLTNNEAIKDLGTVRGRVGYAWDRILLYGTGGVAWSHKATVDFTCTGPCVPSAANDSHSLNGYTVGGGVEYGITPNLSAKAEYLYAHLEPTDYFVSLGCAGTCSTGANVNLVRLGLNWRFSNASAADMPVKALSYKAPPAGATYNWSGLYVGVNGGYGMGQTTGDWFGLRGGNFDIEGALFGGQIGLNYQFPASPLVIGVEADWDWSDIKGSSTLGWGGRHSHPQRGDRGPRHRARPCRLRLGPHPNVRDGRLGLESQSDGGFHMYRTLRAVSRE